MYDDLGNTSTLDGSAANKSPTDSDDSKDRQLRKPKQSVVEASQLDFAVVGFEKTGASVDVHIMCHVGKHVFSMLLLVIFYS